MKVANFSQNFKKIDKSDLIDFIKESINKLRDKIIIPVHHYQSSDIVQFADIIGDSYKLSVESAKSKASFIIFCGVMFMAEGASILTKNYQKVLIPNPHAGCPLADMADLMMVKKAFEKLKKEVNNEVVPVVYINSYADLKSFCGENKGSVCTSSNAEKIINYYLKEGKSVLFFPDYYLGINTANKLNINENEIAKLKKNLHIETTGNIHDAKIILWDGFCPIHHNFSTSDISNLRKNYPGIKIIVHPECKLEVVKESDLSGSTEKIYQTIKNAEKGSIWGIGTETTFVERIANENKDKTILPLKTSVCKNMSMTTLQNLATSLESINEFIKNKKNPLKYEVRVNDEYREYAKIALEKMIEIVEKN